MITNNNDNALLGRFIFQLFKKPLKYSLHGNSRRITANEGHFFFFSKCQNGSDGNSETVYNIIRNDGSS